MGRRIKRLASLLLMATVSAVAQSSEPLDVWERVLYAYDDERGRVNFAGIAAGTDEMTA